MNDSRTPSLIVGRVRGVCAARCRYDTEGVCAVCQSLDPDEYVVYRLPTKETAEREAALSEFAKTAARLGVDPSILQVHRG